MSQPNTPSEYLRAARELSGRLRLAILASFNPVFLRPYLVVEGSRAGVPLEVWTGPFGQIEQPVLEDSSDLWSSDPQVGLIFARLLDIEPSLKYEISDQVRRKSMAGLRERVVGLAREFRARSSAPLLVANFCLDRSVPALFDASQPDGLGHLIAAENQALARELAELTDTHVLDYAAVVSRVGTARFFDSKLWTLAKTAASHEGHVALARDIARVVRALTRAALKCIVVDLDNTLWGGVVGDDGVGALKLGDDGAGAPYKELQRALRSLRDRGFLLAIASKNDKGTALEAIDKHPEMILRSRDFAAMAISWSPKPVGLQSIARTLELGLDALIFVDDNPVERATVRAALPAVEVLELPQDAIGFVHALLTAPGLDRPRLLTEDIHRADMVSADTARYALRDEAPSIASFLQELRMVARVGRAGEEQIERIHQLINKTNQWNLTTRRYSLHEVRRLAASQTATVVWLRLKDRYGDLGLVCVGILRAQEDCVEIDTLLMSCRVMGRQVEDAFLSYLAELAKQWGGKRMRGLFQPTAKNSPVKSFYADHGFTLLETTSDRQLWERALNDFPPWPQHIARLDADEAQHE